MNLNVSFAEALKGVERKVSYKIPSTGAEESLLVKVPAGAVNGGKLRYKKRGEFGVNGGGRGDLVICTVVSDHPLFKRDGADIRLEVPISIYEAALGATIEVPTPDNTSVKLKIPKGTQDGKTFRFKDMGAVNVRRKGTKGALYVTVKVKVPSPLSTKEHDALQKAQKASECELREDLMKSAKL